MDKFISTLLDDRSSTTDLSRPPPPALLLNAFPMSTQGANINYSGFLGYIVGLLDNHQSSWNERIPLFTMDNSRYQKLVRNAPCVNPCVVDDDEDGVDRASDALAAMWKLFPRLRITGRDDEQQVQWNRMFMATSDPIQHINALPSSSALGDSHVRHKRLQLLNALASAYVFLTECVVQPSGSAITSQTPSENSPRSADSG